MPHAPSHSPLHRLQLLQLLAALLVLVLALSSTASAGQVKCKPSPLELVFAVDVSSSLTRSDFAKLKDFLKKVAGSLPIGEKHTRPAVVSFSTNATIEVNLGEANTRRQFGDRVDAIPYYRGFTATGTAMQLARTRVFNRARPGAGKLLVVITDGRTNHPGSRQQALELLKAESAELAAAAVRVHAVGIGGIWLEDELRSISGGDDYSMINDFSSLTKMVQDLVKDICEVHCTDVGKVKSLPGPCFNGTQRVVHVQKVHNQKLNRCEKSITYEYRYCGQSHLCKDIDTKIGDCVNGKRSVVTSWEDYDVQQQRCVLKETVEVLDCNAIEECKEPVADIVFILDSSGSIKKKHWKQQIQFVQRLISSMKIGNSAIRIGVVRFGTGAKDKIQLGAIPSQSSLLKSVGKIKQPWNQATNTGLGIRFAGGQFRSRGRPGVRRVAILMTDGESNRGPNAIVEASALESMGVSIIVVGVGSSLRKEELRAIASPPLKDHLFYATDFNKLMAWAAKISEEACESITPPDPKLCDLPPKRVISTCYRGIQKITEIRFEYDSNGVCNKKFISKILNKCPLLCTDPINGNHYYEGEQWQSECNSFVCQRLKPNQAFRPRVEKCQSVRQKCQDPSSKNIFKCHDETGSLFSHCSCKAGIEMNIITADAGS